MKESRILLLGAGSMAQAYAKVLKALKVNFSVAGRSEISAATFLKETGIKPSTGGLEKFLAHNDETYSKAIVATSAETLAHCCSLLLDDGIKNILLEKPGGLNSDEIAHVNSKAVEKKANVCIAYNRRFYSSVNKAVEFIKNDGGITSFHFEFTEWSHVIEPLKKEEGLKERWFLLNSTHVVDLAFYLGGKPEEIVSFSSGSLSWHPKSVYSGAGISGSGALFSYHANWQAPGRWGVELMTKKHKLILRPLEALQIQNLGSVEINKVDIDDALDKNFKPGLYKQTKAFLEDDLNNFCTIEEQHNAFTSYYRKICGY